MTVRVALIGSREGTKDAQVSLFAAETSHHRMLRQ